MIAEALEILHAIGGCAGGEQADVGVEAKRAVVIARPRYRRGSGNGGEQLVDRSDGRRSATEAPRQDDAFGRTRQLAYVGKEGAVGTKHGVALGILEGEQRMAPVVGKIAACQHAYAVFLAIAFGGDAIFIIQIQAAEAAVPRSEKR